MSVLCARTLNGDSSRLFLQDLFPEATDPILTTSAAHSGLRGSPLRFFLSGSSELPGQGGAAREDPGVRT